MHVTNAHKNVQQMSADGRILHWRPHSCARTSEWNKITSRMQRKTQISCGKISQSIKHIVKSSCLILLAGPNGGERVEFSCCHCGQRELWKCCRWNAIYHLYNSTFGSEAQRLCLFLSCFSVVGLIGRTGAARLWRLSILARKLPVTLKRIVVRRHTNKRPNHGETSRGCSKAAAHAHRLRHQSVTCLEKSKLLYS